MNKKKSTTFKEIVSFVLAVIVALAIRTFIFEPFTIPSPSMHPTLIEGDYIVVYKWPYGISKHSIIKSPNIFSGRLFQQKSPERGDIIVFKNPRNDDEYWVKRLIGLPGDKIKIIDGAIFLNGNKLERKDEGIYHFPNLEEKAQLYQEFLPSGVNYQTLDSIKNHIADNTEEFIVPEKHYFFMGDNRDNSADSRLSLGYVHEDYIIGKAEFMLFSNDETILNPLKWLYSFKSHRWFRGLYDKKI